MAAKISALLLTICLSLPAARIHAAPVIELFTSQGCYSCPPADEFLAAVIEQRPDVVALEFHVDYWDDLVYGSAGTWKDPFSQAAFTTRQRQYNSVSLQGSPGVYTPQMIVNGATAAVGSRRAEVQRALDKDVPELTIEITRFDDELEISVGELGSTATIWLAHFDRHQITDVSAGENKGKIMENHHVVRSFVPVAQVSPDEADPLRVAAAKTGENTGCAVLVQDNSMRRMLGAVYCPM
jgi:hypothetical protein